MNGTKEIDNSVSQTTLLGAERTARQPRSGSEGDETRAQLTKDSVSRPRLSQFAGTDSCGLTA